MLFPWSKKLLSLQRTWGCFRPPLLSWVWWGPSFLWPTGRSPPGARSSPSSGVSVLWMVQPQLSGLWLQVLILVALSEPTEKLACLCQHAAQRWPGPPAAQGLRGERGDPRQGRCGLCQPCVDPVPHGVRSRGQSCPDEAQLSSPATRWSEGNERGVHTCAGPGTTETQPTGKEVLTGVLGSVLTTVKRKKWAESRNPPLIFTHDLVSCWLTIWSLLILCGRMKESEWKIHGQTQLQGQGSPPQLGLPARSFLHDLGSNLHFHWREASCLCIPMTVSQVSVRHPWLRWWSNPVVRAP